MALKILSVDDSKTIRMIIAKTFKAFDCDVIEASNGVEGLTAASKYKPQLIILDLTMPVMDGVEMLTKLKGDPAMKGIPVIMLTAEAGKDNVLKIAKLGVRDYLVKPFKEDALLEKVSRIVQLQPRTGGKTAVKTLEDPASVLVLEDKPAIVQQITDGLNAMTPWNVIGKTTLLEAIEEVSLGTPDAVIVSLTLADDAGFNFFQELRMRGNTRSVPVFGMCIKTDGDKLHRAEQMGFSGVVTKPIDMDVLLSKLVKAMNVDTSSRYYTLEEDILLLSLPAKISNQNVNEIEHYLQPKIDEMVNAGVNKLLMDLTRCSKVDTTIVKLILATTKRCHDVNILFRIAGNSTVSGEIKSFAEAAELQIDPSIDEAKAFLHAQKADA
jgi:two-component system, cell cycle response regulator